MLRPLTRITTFRKHQNLFVVLLLIAVFVLIFKFFQLRSAYLGIAMMTVMHLYFRFTQPLFIQSLMTLKNVYDAKLVQIYILGKEAKGDLERPFKATSLFGGMACNFFCLPHSKPIL